ncbi:unnamed protein product [Clonostachys rosea]|uniref:1,3-beta-glucanosyltransferase n=1 Tax=Bionectria ochroleuca TaxID=29856 RepID=A0ABY6UEZ5_BIOOC|nr:unnamed protein product [Clonostachys rosea]
MLLSAALVALTATVVGAVPTLEIKGNDFVVPGDGTKFEIVGMAYQPGGSSGYDPAHGKDPLSNADVCLRDAALMQVLGVNAIRVYNVNPDINHDECASIFNAAGMYMMIDVNSPRVGEAISSFEPWTTYYAAYLNRTFAVVEAFANYPNTLLFFSGNEIINDIESAKEVPPYMRAVTRDLKNYIKNNIKRQIPVGYSAADVREVLWDTYNYVTCAIDGKEDDASRADLFALNSYSWCGKDATFKSSTFDKLVDGLKESPVPTFFSEYGCIETKERWWNETKSIYGPDMYDTFSGGVVYEWTLEENGYGLVKIDDSQTTLQADYNRLKDKYSDLDWESIFKRKAGDSSNKPVECSSSLITEEGFKNNFTLPAVPPGASELIKDGIKKKPSGKIVEIKNWKTTLKVVDNTGNTINDLQVVKLADDEFNYYGKNKVTTGTTTGNSSSTSTTNASSSTDKGDSAAGMTLPMVWSAAVPLLAMLLI